MTPMASPILFVKKKNGKYRMCVDYRAVNNMTVKNRYPLPRTNELIDKLQGAKYFTKIDLRNGYNLVRIKEGDEWKTAFRTKYGLYEWLVMPFGLTNAPSAFQFFMNDMLKEVLDVYAVVYLDDILIFSNTKEEHTLHVRNVLLKLRENKLYANAEKCHFNQEEVEYLGIIASGTGVRVDPVKVKTVQEWPVPKSVKNIQEFVGFANFYRRFVHNYSNLAAPMYQLLKKDVPWRWGPAEQASFQGLKDALTSSPVLRQPDIDRPFFVECDASDYATGAVLSQKNDKGKLHPVAFLSKSLAPAEQNYDIFDKELLAVIRACKEWRHFLEGSATPFTVLTDHKNLEYFSKSKVLNRRQIRWMGFLSDFNFVIQYRPGAENGKADILSRRLDHLPPLGGGEPQALISPELFLHAITPDFEIESLIRDTQDEDEQLKEALELLREGKAVKDWTLVDGMAQFKGKIFVPKDNHV